MNWSVPDVLTGLLVLITAVYVVLTYGIMRATRASVAAMERQAEDLSRPLVTVSPAAAPRSFILFLRVSNAGRTAAKDLRLELDRPFYRFGRQTEPIGELAAFTNTIASLAPGSDLVFSLATGPQLFGDKYNEETTPRAFKVTASYSFGEKRVTEVLDVDLRPFEGMHMSFDPVVEELHRIGEGLKDIKKALARLTSANQGP